MTLLKKETAEALAKENRKAINARLATEALAEEMFEEWCNEPTSVQELIAKAIQEGREAERKDFYREHIVFPFKTEELKKEVSKQAKLDLIAKIEKMLHELNFRSAHPLDEILPEFKKQGLKVAVLDGGWVNWFDLDKAWQKIKQGAQGA
jgi:hypothetical protein